MRIWLACFFVLFALAKLFDWVQELSVPLPIYILGGAFLAVASNYDKFFGSYLSNAISEAPSEQPQLDSPPQISFTISPNSKDLPQSEAEKMP